MKLLRTALRFAGWWIPLTLWMTYALMWIPGAVRFTHLWIIVPYFAIVFGLMYQRDTLAQRLAGMLNGVAAGWLIVCIFWALCWGQSFYGSWQNTVAYTWSGNTRAAMGLDFVAMWLALLALVLTLQQHGQSWGKVAGAWLRRPKGGIFRRACRGVAAVMLHLATWRVAVFAASVLVILTFCTCNGTFSRAVGLIILTPFMFAVGWLHFSRTTWKRYTAIAIGMLVNLYMAERVASFLVEGFSFYVSRSGWLDGWQWRRPNGRVPSTSGDFVILVLILLTVVAGAWLWWLEQSQAAREAQRMANYIDRGDPDLPVPKMMRDEFKTDVEVPAGWDEAAGSIRRQA